MLRGPYHNGGLATLFPCQFDEVFSSCSEKIATRRDDSLRLRFCIRMLGYTKRCPTRRRIERASKIPGSEVGVQFEETRYRDLSPR
jgi:hypothetical protein